MKLIHFLFTSLLLLFQGNIQSQTINWNTLGLNSKYIISLHFGIEHGLTYGFSIGYQINSKHPAIIDLGYSSPLGKNNFDDLKVKIGGQLSVYQNKNFQILTSTFAVFRRYENEYGRIVNFGGDFSAGGGYYSANWFIANEIGFDKAIITNFKHKKFYKENFPQAKGGWYEPTTGGNFYYGFQTGASMQQTDIYLKLGKMLTQNFKAKPLIPFYGSVGISIK